MRIGKRAAAKQAAPSVVDWRELVDGASELQGRSETECVCRAMIYGHTAISSLSNSIYGCSMSFVLSLAYSSGTMAVADAVARRKPAQHNRLLLPGTPFMLDRQTDRQTDGETDRH
jgi:hypothetical protein